MCVLWAKVRSTRPLPTMRTTLLPLAFLPLCKPAAAQLTAGGVPPGGTVLQTSINLSLSTPNTTDSASLELDCDDFQDAWAVLHRDMPEVDGTNWAALHVVDDDIEVCVDLLPGFSQRPKYHLFGEPLDCGANFNWQLVGELYLGNFGGWVITGPFEIDDRYIAYRRNGQVGWIKLSFQLDQTTISLQVPELLPLCPITLGIDEQPGSGGFTLFPNPGRGREINVMAVAPLEQIEVFDATGRTLARHAGTARTIPAPISPGTYLVRATQADGTRSTMRWVRQD